MQRARWIAWGCLCFAPACIASSVVESSGRAVTNTVADLAWRPVRTEDLRGFYESVSIEGEVAASLLKVYYVFAADGSYSGAALALGAENPEFQTLTGRWTLNGEILDFGDGQTARVSATDDHLKLENEGGTAILRRAVVQ